MAATTPGKSTLRWQERRFCAWRFVRRSDDKRGFVVLPRRWVVERTLGWMIRWRRLVRDYEQRIDVSEAMIHVALGGLMLRRISH